MRIASNGHFCADCDPGRQRDAGNHLSMQPSGATPALAARSLAFTQMPHPMHSSSDSFATLSAAVTSMQSLPAAGRPPSLALYLPCADAFCSCLFVKESRSESHQFSPQGSSSCTRGGISLDGICPWI